MRLNEFFKSKEKFDFKKKLSFTAIKNMLSKEKGGANHLMRGAVVEIPGLVYHAIVTRDNDLAAWAAVDESPDDMNKAVKKTREELGHTIEIHTLWINQHYANYGAGEALLGHLINSIYHTESLGICLDPHTPSSVFNAINNMKFKQVANVAPFKFFVRKK